MDFFRGLAGDKLPSQTLPGSPGRNASVSCDAVDANARNGRAGGKAEQSHGLQLLSVGD